MSRRSSLKDVARLAGVSQTTASLVLNNAPLAARLASGTRERVLTAAKELHYRPSYFALNLTKNRSESVGVISPEHSEGYFTAVMEGVERYLIQKRYLYFTACHYWKPKLMQEYPGLLVDRGAEGLLFLNTAPATALPVPVVAISAHTQREGVTNVVLDHDAAARLTLQHLYERGHRHIAFMKGPEVVMDSEPRWSATLHAAQDFGIAVLPDLVVQVTDRGWSPQIGYAPARELLSRGRRFTALVCFNDTSAVGAIRALHDGGVRVPSQVSVVGFDDIVTAEFHVPSLTTIRQPLISMGRIASKILLKRIANPGDQYPARALIKPELIIRESTAPAIP